MTQQQTFTADEFRAELDRLGEKKVRDRHAAQAYGTVGDKYALVVEWLRQKDQNRQNRPAWIAAIAAIIATLAAIASAIFAGVQAQLF